MKKFFILYKLLFVSLVGHCQLNISTGAQWVNSGNASVVLQDMNLVNDGSIIAGTGSFKFTGSQNSTISGNSLPLFNILEISKSNNAKVLLNRNISIASLINFISGQLDLNNNNIVLSPTANIAGESENNRIIGPNGGFIEIRQNMNAPASVNAGNLGATISSSANLGNVTIRRGHLPQSGTGLTTGIRRYYLIDPENNNSLNTTLRLKYFDTELNGQDEHVLVIYQSNNNGTDWSNLSQTTRNSNANWVEKTGVVSLSLQTLANNNVVAVDGVTDLVFTGQRKKPTEVQLNWTSQTETNMSGYEVQRKLDNEVDFSPRTFVNSSAPGGNSLSLLSYQNKDANSHTGISYYRLKIVSLNANFTYSNVISVGGKSKGGGGNNNNLSAEEVITTTTKSNMSLVNSQKITVGPNPNNGNFWFSVNGIEKETIATLYTIDGRQIKQIKVVNLQQQKVSGIPTGMYLLKIPGFETQKIIVNGSGNATPQSTQSNNNIKL
jgi:hypothetical protein